MRLDIDNMSYEVNTTFCFFPLALQIWAFLLTLPLDCPQDLLALGEFMGNVNTGLADEKISKCVREVVCCSSDQTQNDLDDQDDGGCVICLVHFCNTSLNWCLYNHGLKLLNSDWWMHYGRRITKTRMCWGYWNATMTSTPIASRSGCRRRIHARCAKQQRLRTPVEHQLCSSIHWF